MTHDRSRELFARAQRSLVGGVNSPVRAFRSVGGDPIYVSAGEGARLIDVDGNRYLDYIGAWGPMIVGHAHPAVTAALHEAISRGTSFGTCSAPEVELAERVKEIFPTIEKIRFVNSGTEATMAAIRLARGATGRDKIVKFAGCYHGHGDAFLVKAGSGALTFGAPDSAGVPPSVAQNTLTARFNDLAGVREIFERNRNAVAGVIVEPVVGNMGVVPPAAGFLAGLRELCDAHGALLIFDEVMTGFRVARGGAQALYGVRPDLTTLGKIIGGGLPVGAYGGPAKIMDLLSPLGPVYQAGTLSGNPLAMTAGLATLNLLTPDLYAQLEAKSARLADGLARAAGAAGVAAQVNRVGSMLTLFFTDRAATDLESAQTTDAKRFASFFRAMLAAGVCLPPSNYEAWFVSAAHTIDDIDITIRAAAEALRRSA